MARDKAYKRDLRRALEEIVKVKSIRTKKGSHIEVVIELPNGAETALTCAGSPRDHHHSIVHTVNTAKKYLKGTYE